MGLILFENKMTTAPNMLVIYTYVKHICMEVTYLNLLESTDLEITKLSLNLGAKLSVISVLWPSVIV